MKLKAFHGGDGDCLILETNDDQPKTMLVDGGRVGPYKDKTRRYLSEHYEQLDLVCISHIDDDHISGILQLVEDEVQWREHEFVKNELDPEAKPPKFERPPQVLEIWHNALYQLVGEDLAVEVANYLRLGAALLTGAEDPQFSALASNYELLASGEKSAMNLSRRISDNQLGIPTNTPAGGGLIKRGGVMDQIPFGSAMLAILGPSDEDLQELQEVWQEKIAVNKSNWLGKLRDELAADERSLWAIEPSDIVPPTTADLGDGTITEANMASLTFLAEDDAHSILMTGDGDSAEILAGLRAQNKLDGNGQIHVTVLKVQHHGAEANVTREFVDAVTADHYIFCGNGNHHNPEIVVVEAMARARMAKMPDREFKFWFTSSSSYPGLTADFREHMRKVEKIVDHLVEESGGLMKIEFMEDGFYFDIL